jgi:hypothetical protein
MKGCKCILHARDLKSGDVDKAKYEVCTMKIIPPLTDEQKAARDRALNPEQVKCGECGATWRDGEAFLMSCQNRHCPVAVPRSSLFNDARARAQTLQALQNTSIAYNCPQCGGCGIDHGCVCDMCNGSGRKK